MTPHGDTHQMIQKMMAPYYNKFEMIKGTMICKAAGIHMRELNLRGACLHHILGGCVGYCERRHPASSSADTAQVKHICDKLRPGIIALTKGEGNAQKRKYGGGGRYQRS